MTTQAVTATVSNANMARVFDATITDGVVFNTANLTDSNSSQQLGLLIPGQTIHQIQATYGTSGLGQWRIFDSVSQQVSRVGFLSQINYVCPMESKITPYVVKKTDLLQVFIKQTNATAGDTECMAWLKVAGQQAQSFQCTTAADKTALEMTNSITGVGLGDAFFGRNLERIQIACETGAFLFECEIRDQTGSTVWRSSGNTRLPTAGGKSTIVNLDIPVGIAVQKGWKIYASTITA